MGFSDAMKFTWEKIIKPAWNYVEQEAQSMEEERTRAQDLDDYDLQKEYNYLSSGDHFLTPKYRTKSLHEEMRSRGFLE